MALGARPTAVGGQLLLAGQQPTSETDQPVHSVLDYGSFALFFLFLHSGKPDSIPHQLALLEDLPHHSSH